MRVLSPYVPDGDRRQLLRQPAAQPALAVELADITDFARLVDQHARRGQRDGQRLVALTLRVQFDCEPDESLRQQWLAQCMHRLRRQVRATDSLARWQTTNFGLLLPRCTPAQAEAVLARLVRFTSGPYRLQDQLPELSVWGCVFKGVNVEVA
jgi:hypothetical protein